MKKRFIFLSILLVIIFVGGFIAGTLYTSPNQQSSKIGKEVPRSSKKPEQKKYQNLIKHNRRY
ncbi:hypothetical protein [Bacillus timonensis]|uniref:hypothetical protein n=1 Tax=Bacillus timonensis TaxID=1033734 RepID=UPI00028946C4|nr:hypothetical protein [Bacillus timonensis]